MLVLGRKKNQTLVIADSIVLRVTQIRGNRVTIGIEAPRDVTILRGELFPRDESEQPVAQVADQPACAESVQCG